MPSIRPATELDFDQIKADIIAFIKTNPTFSDYNFTGSALNSVVDMLAYNTHTNAYYANMLNNEGFIDTAQKRASVVSRAKELGYTPRSAVCSSAFVDVKFSEASPNKQFSLDRGSLFTSVNDSGSHSFYVANDISTTNEDGYPAFKNVKIVNGIYASNSFKVDVLSNVHSLFTIPNKNIDISTLRVFVKDSIGAIEQTEYFLSKNVYELQSNSKVYFIQESYDGFFQIYFGGNVIGLQPTAQNIININYFNSESYSLADGCRLFNSDFGQNKSGNINIETSQVSFGGSDKEDINSIKFNAVKSNSAKSRSVTADDYMLMLKDKFNFIKTVSVWGGEDNIPPVYGKIFISIQPVSGYSISESVEREIITPVIKSNSLMTVGIEYIVPSYVSMYFSTKIKYTTTQTLYTKLEIEGLVKNTIKNYINSISSFNTDYLESLLITKISASDASIVSVNIDKLLGFNITPLIGIESNHVRNINNKIKAGTISSTKFSFLTGEKENIVTIKEIPNKQTTKNILSAVVIYSDVGLFDEEDLLIKKIGEVDLNSGYFNLTFTVDSYNSTNRGVSIKFSVVDSDVVVDRNQILILENLINTTDTNNVVVVETYGK